MDISPVAFGVVFLNFSLENPPRLNQPHLFLRSSLNVHVYHHLSFAVGWMILHCTWSTPSGSLLSSLNQLTCSVFINGDLNRTPTSKSNRLHVVIFSRFFVLYKFEGYILQDSSKLIGGSPQVLNFNRLLLKFNWFIMCNYIVFGIITDAYTKYQWPYESK